MYRRLLILLLAMGSFFMGGGLYAAAQQASSASTASTSSATSQAYATEQKALGQELAPLVAQGATAQQLQAWAQQNSARLAAQRQRAAALALATGMATRSTDKKIKIPADAPSDLKTFLEAQQALGSARARIHNQLVQQAVASGKASTLSDLSSLEKQEEQLFAQQNAATLKQQATRAQALASEMTRQTVAVPAAVIPANATPAQAAFMQTRNQLHRSLAQLRNQYASATPAERDAALATWQEQNAALLKQLKQQAQSLSQSATN